MRRSMLIAARLALSAGQGDKRPNSGTAVEQQSKSCPTHSNTVGQSLNESKVLYVQF